MMNLDYLTAALIPICGCLVGCCMVLCIGLIILMIFCAKENNDDWTN